MTSKIRIVLADDHVLLRQLLGCHLRRQPDFEDERRLVILDPDTQLGYFGGRPVRHLATAATRCQVESDGKTVISLDWMDDDK